MVCVKSIWRAAAEKCGGRWLMANRYGNFGIVESLNPLVPGATQKPKTSGKKPMAANNLSAFDEYRADEALQYIYQKIRSWCICLLNGVQ